jgi:hypothetical protein
VQRPDVLTVVLAELADDSEPVFLLQYAAARSDGAQAAGGRSCDGVGDERALSRPGRALDDEKRSRACLCVRQRTVEGTELGLSLEERSYGVIGQDSHRG